MLEIQKKKNDRINGFVFIETIICLLIIFLTCTQKEDIASKVFTLSFLTLLLFYILDSLKLIWQYRSPNLYTISIVFFSFINVLVSTSKANEKMSFDYLNHFFIFVSTVLFFDLSVRIKIGKKSLNFIFLSHIIISIVYWYTYKFFPQTYSPVSSNALTLNFTNQNLTGMFLFLSVLYMILGFLYYRKLIVKLFFLCVAILDFSLMLKTESRNVLLALFLFFLLLCLAQFNINNKFSNFINLAINVAPILFVPLYLFYVNIVIKKGWFDFLVSEGKQLDSRVDVWNKCLDTLGNMWLTGNYAEGSGNSHNSHMVLLCSFGIVILCMVIIFTYRIIRKLSEKTENKFQLYCIAAFFAVIFMGFGEGALYSGGLCLYILCGTLLIMANSDLNR